ncbi:MAG: hypothetical protein CL908_17945 [Deltaproteobacteria bacterium]|nr:hypothetical protein [Deltaproteobacteria bacterium]
MLRCVAVVLTVLGAGASLALGQGMFTGQFAAFSPPTGFEFDNVQGEWINYEPPPTHPLLVTSDGSFVVTAHEADQRVVVRDTGTLLLRAEIVVGQGAVAIAERSDGTLEPAGPITPGGTGGTLSGGSGVVNIAREIWVVLRNQAGVAVINAQANDPANWRVTNILRRPVPTGSVGAGAAAFPADIAFTGDLSIAGVTASQTDELVLFDANQKTWIADVALEMSHNGTLSRLNEPRNIVAIGNRFYVASHLSGNQTISAPGDPFGLLGLIFDLNALPGFSLPDFDVMEVNATTQAVTGVQKDIGSSIFGMAVHPGTGDLIVANLNQRNGAFIGEGSFAGGRVSEHRITFLQPGSAPPTYNVVDTLDLIAGAPATHCSMPSDIVVDGSGRVFVTGYTSSNVAVFDSAGTFLGVIPTGVGPRGIDVSGGDLYVLCRGDRVLQVFDVSGAGLPTGPANTASLGRYDPTWDDVAEGRRVWLDPTHSGDHSANCNTCHHDLRDDGVAWDLSKFHDAGVGFTLANPPGFWKDRKFTMVTQDLRSLPETAPYHWRGEQKDLDDFNGAFVGLLKGTELDPGELADLKAYVFSAVYPPNPEQQVNRTFSAPGDSGRDLFQNFNSDGNGAGTVIRTCEDCHSLPLGTDNSMTDPFVLNNGTTTHGTILKTVVTTQMRGMWDKSSSATNISGVGGPFLLPVTGFGFNHQGSDLSMDGFVNRNFSLINQAQKDDVNAFQHEFDSGLAPSTMFSEMLDQSTVTTQHIGGFAINQTNAFNCDLVAVGRLKRFGTWNDVELIWDRSLQRFQFSDTTQNAITFVALRNLAASGNAELLFLGTPVHSGERIGVDRDRDGVRNFDEIAAGLDPSNPDTDGDGMWDGEDPQPSTFNMALPILPAPIVSNLKIWYRTTNTIKITYDTDRFSPTHVEFGQTTAYGRTSGDALNQPPGSNHWRRHHTVFLRLLDDGQAYHFRILTRNQTGQGGQTGDLNTSSPADHFAPNLRIQTLTQTTSLVGGITTFTVEVVITDNLGQPFQGADVNGTWTFFRGGNPLISLLGDGTSDVTGKATITIAGGVLSGDQMDFSIPMFRGTGANTEPGIVDTVSPAGFELPFHWPENAKSCVKVTVP